MFKVFLDAPHVLSPVDLAETFNTTEELGAAEASEVDPALKPRGWWHPDPDRKKTRGIEDSLIMLRDILAKDHYEVSQMTLFIDSKYALISSNLKQGVFGFRQVLCLLALDPFLQKPSSGVYLISLRHQPKLQPRSFNGCDPRRTRAYNYTTPDSYL